VPQAMPYETQGVGDVDHLVERVLHVAFLVMSR